MPRGEIGRIPQQGKVPGSGDGTQRMQTAIFPGLVGAALWAGIPYASAAEVDWTRDGLGLLAGTVAVSLAAWRTVALAAGWRGAFRFLAATVALAWLAEVVGLEGGWLFGCAYRYSSALRPVLPGGVPLFIPLAWFSLAGIPVLLLHGWRTTRPDGSPDAVRTVAKAAWSALGMVACDLALDPVAVSLGLWTWERPGPYFGVPWMNFAGWWLVSFLVFWAGYGWAFRTRAAEADLPLRHEAAWGVAHGALLVLLAVAVWNRAGSAGPLWLALAAMLPLSLFWLNRLHARIRAAGFGALRATRGGPGPRPDFSTVWKKVFHSVETPGHFFHTMEKVFAIFPHNGKNVSTVWKNRESPDSARAAVPAAAGEGAP